MWGESSKTCEMDCQCSGLITDSFKINSGNNATKRRREESLTHNFKLKMNPNSLKFSPLSPLTQSPLTQSPSTPRKVLGEIQNNLNSPTLLSFEIERIKSPKSTPLSSNLKLFSLSSTQGSTQNTPLSSNLKHFPLSSTQGSTQNTPLSSNLKHFPLSSTQGSTQNTPLSSNLKHFSLSSTQNTPLTAKLGSTGKESKSYKRSSSKISKIFEERNRFKTAKLDLDKENFVEFQINEETNDVRISPVAHSSKDWDVNNIQLTNPKRNFANLRQPSTSQDPFEMDFEPDFETLHDLDREFDCENFEQCSKYEIISTDSPNIISRGRTATKIESKTFNFGAPITDLETSTSFNTKKPKTPEKRSFTVKKSLKFTETPTKSPISIQISPVTRFNSESLESGFISTDEYLDIEESSSPKITNFNELLSAPIKNDLQEFSLKRPALCRSLSYNPEGVKSKLFNSPKKGFKRFEKSSFESNSKRRKSNQRPPLQRAYSENAASIMSALARSASNPDLIGDFSQPFALPIIDGNHSDLKSISSETLAGLLRGEYDDRIGEYQVIDCRYPYEFEGGHITGARNLYNKEQIMSLIDTPVQNNGEKRSILVFHCEFSLERGPKLCRFLRSSDRAHNRDRYPHLNWPETYLLHKGYSSFYKSHSELCSPKGYREMLHPNYKAMLSVFRNK